MLGQERHVDLNQSTVHLPLHGNIRVHNCPTLLILCLQKTLGDREMAAWEGQQRKQAQEEMAAMEKRMKEEAARKVRQWRHQVQRAWSSSCVVLADNANPVQQLAAGPRWLGPS